ncbi:putative Ubiquitin-like domain, CAP Gly-rich domain, Ubiquitin-like domain superfamily [Helianthus debilis subsp. tardiflorus]
MASRLQLPGDDSVLLRVTHSNLKTFSSDVRFSLESTVEAVKDKLWKKCGTAVASMSLELYDDTGAKVSDVNDNSRPFGFYSPLDGLVFLSIFLLTSIFSPTCLKLIMSFVYCRYRLHIIDLDPSSVTSGGWLEDTSLVEKYKISDEAYDKLDGTYRKFKEKLGPRNTSAQGSKMDDDYMKDICANIKVGDRCQVEPGEKRGVVKFVGRAEALGPGFWVGVQYDEPLGKHDGL